ncbi:Ig-like domain-containing domain [Pedobacter sp. MW01-1-1]|uniref:Ig-like domain-containing domain n=1 Tax=Pedobacter sp. MW01-1-1 TaxID=3383027 RepID=UPI003FF06745
MQNLKYQYFHLKNLVLASALLLLSSCASMQSPQGGPRDSIPPQILNMTPKNRTRNFSAKKITIEFDEYFNIKDETKEFSISPEQETPPLLRKRKKNLEIVFQDSLEKNTTYTLNFGKAIADVNESNTVKNLSYVFSTGAELDSLYISGKVLHSLTGEAEKEALVFILPIERDTLFGKKKASIYTYTDSSGNFKLSNLRRGMYKIYALKESSGDKIYQQAIDDVAYQKDPLTLDKNIENIDLHLFKELASDFRVTDRKLNNDGSITLAFNQQLKSPKITISQPTDYEKDKKIYFNKTNDTAKIWLKDLTFDSVKVNIEEQGKVLQTVNFSRGKKDTYTQELNIQDNVNGGKLSPYTPYTIDFNFPIAATDPSKIILLEDSVKRTGFELVKDTSKLLQYAIKYPWKNKRTYIVKFLPEAFTAIYGVKNKEINKTFVLGTTDEYTTLVLNTTVPDTSKNYLIQFLTEKKQVIETFSIKKDTKITFSKHLAGKYMVRVVYDENKNGIWDTGNIKENMQPEKIWYTPILMDLKPNWEREDPLQIPPLVK